MRACTSPLRTSRLRPLRISLPSTETWRSFTTSSGVWLMSALFFLRDAARGTGRRWGLRYPISSRPTNPPRARRAGGRGAVFFNPATRAGSSRMPWSCWQTHADPRRSRRRSRTRGRSRGRPARRPARARAAGSAGPTRASSSSLRLNRARSVSIASVPTPAPHQALTSSRISCSEKPRPCSCSIQRTRSTALGVVQAEAAARAGGRLEQPELLVQVDRPHGLARSLGDVADAQELRVLWLLECRHHSNPYVRVRLEPER